MNTHSIGVAGEDLAVKYLSKYKYKILERNFRCKFGEIYIIAFNEGFITFVEVKSRSDEKFGLPREAVSPYKQQRIASAAQYWLYTNKLVGRSVRFDVVEILSGKVNVLKDAFRPQ